MDGWNQETSETSCRAYAIGVCWQADADTYKCIGSHLTANHDLMVPSKELD